MRLTFTTLLCSLTLAVAAAGCKKSDTSATKHKRVTTGSTAGDTMVGALALALDENTNVSDSQKATITKAAARSGKAALSAASLSMKLEDASELEVVSAAIMGGAIGALDEAGIEAADAAALEKLKDVVDTIETSLLKSLESGDLLSGMTIDQKKAVVAGMIADAVGALDDAGVSAENTLGIVGDLMREGTAALADSGFEASEIDDALGEITLEAMAALNDCGLPEASLDEAALALVQQALAGLNDLELSAEQLQQALTEFSSSVVAGMNDAGIPADMIDDTAKEAFADIIGNLDELGVAPTAIDEFANEIAAAAVAESNGMTGVDVGDLAAAIAGGVVGGLDEAGMTDEQIAASAAEVAEACVGALSEAGVDASAVGTIGDEIAAGAIDGLGDAGLDQTQINQADDAINSGADTAATAEAGQINSGVTWDLGGPCTEAPTDQTKLEVFAPMGYGDANGKFCLAPDSTYNCGGTFDALVTGGTFSLQADEATLVSYCVYTLTPIE